MNEETSQTTTKPLPTNLKEVIAIIPESCYDNPTWKGLAYVFRDLVIYAVLLAALLSTDNMLFVLPLWALSGLVVSALFVVGHDAAHYALFKQKWLCDWAGRITMAPSMHIYASWQLGHNRIHHGFTVQEQRDFVWHPYSPADYEKLTSFQKLLHRLEWSWAGAGIYYLIEVWWRKMIVFQPPKNWVKPIRQDRVFLLGVILAGVAALAWFALSVKGFAGMDAVWYTAWLSFKVIVVPWFLFNYFIGAVVYLHHINPEIKWHDHQHWNKFKGQMEGTMVYRVKPKIIDFFIHKIMIHVPHHVDMRIPFYRLEEAAEHLKAHYPDTVKDVPLRLSDYVRFTRCCKLYDFEAEVWMNYKQQVVKRVA